VYWSIRGGRVTTGSCYYSALPLRVLGAVHRHVLARAAPTLAPFYPPVGGRPVWPDVWLAFRDVIAARADQLRPALACPPQTNEVRRSAVAQHTELQQAQR